MTKKKLVRNILISAIIAAAASIVGYYVYLPPLNAQSPEFWMSLAFAIGAFGVPFLLLSGAPILEIRIDTSAKKKVQKSGTQSKLPTVIVVLLIVAPIAVMLIGQLISSPAFHATTYAGIISVKEAVFEEDMPETDSVTNIALMDSDTASVIGNRTLGSLADVVSQYGISSSYSQINFARTPKKVAHLEYLGFFKWVNNRSAGIPGYVMVDPVKNSAEYKKFETPMRYVESGYFGDDLMRKLRFDYPTKIFGSCSFEVDEAGKPYYIVSCLKPQVMMFGAPDVSEVIIFDPCTGSSELLPVSEAPAWIDCVYTGSLACEKYDWFGCLSGGFFNSIIGNVGCKQTTDDFGYIVIEDDVWYFTGVTSVTADESNIGFILSNARTGEYKFYPVVGAEEYSAMGAAQGEVQEKGYTASFPSLVNISGEATYIMVLKDANSIVKLYALVNVENYSIVATGATQEDVMIEYKRLLVQNNVIDESEITNPPESDPPTSEAEAFTVTVERIELVAIDGNSHIYLFTADSTDSTVRICKGMVKADETLLFIHVGDSLTVKALPTDAERIYTIVSFEINAPDLEG
jgi:hypothetical protein